MVQPGMGQKTRRFTGFPGSRATPTAAAPTFRPLPTANQAGEIPPFRQIAGFLVFD
jgi:hypothetical protein